MSEIHYGWANLPSPTHGFEIAYDEDGVAYVYGQGDDAQARAQRIISALQGTSELTALRQQVADLRAALEKVIYAMEQHGPADQRWVDAVIAGNTVLAATQPQEVQP